MSATVSGPERTSWIRQQAHKKGFAGRALIGGVLVLVELPLLLPVIVGAVAGQVFLRLYLLVRRPNRRHGS